MNNKLLKQSYNECHKIFKKNAKTYYFGALLFDYEKFLHVCAFYGLVRVVDDFVDLENCTLIIYLQQSMPISPKTSQPLPRFETNFG